MQTQVEQPQKKEAVFDENGQTIEEIVTAPEEPAQEEFAETPAETETPAPQLKGDGKYRIGDRYFQTQDEALAYAQSQVSALETEQQIADAYRQGMREALLANPQTAQEVTPQVTKQSEFDTEELYTNPQAFLDKYATKIKSETRAELEQRDNLRTASDQIWHEFMQRHPMLADFRREVEDFANANQNEVRAVIATKGRPAGYDYVATKIKARFEAYANAVKPKRELPNNTQGASPSSKAAGVTPKAEAKKPLSFAEQVRSLKKQRR